MKNGFNFYSLKLPKKPFSLITGYYSASTVSGIGSRSLFSSFWGVPPRKYLMKNGMSAPRRMVVMQTMIRVVLLTIEAWWKACWSCSSASMVRMSAKATDPLIVPAIETMDNSL